MYLYICTILFQVKRMLKIVHSMDKLRFCDLMDVYAEGNIINGKEFYPNLSEAEQVRNAEDDFYQYLYSVFFRQDHSVYAVWEVDKRYVSALRLEPYSDGMLLCALETAPNARRNGYATKLITSVQAYLMQQGSGTIYSHVSKRNLTSLAVHRKCGFQIIKDHAVYSDGSLSQSSYTMAYKFEKSET